MKKILLLTMAASMFMGLSSCKKSYTCTCTAGGASSSVLYEDVSKSDAEDACAATSTAWAITYPGSSCLLIGNN